MTRTEKRARADQRRQNVEINKIQWALKKARKAERVQQLQLSTPLQSTTYPRKRTRYDAPDKFSQVRP